jgi:V/A-type H+-transporting ATPase subunit D
MVEEKIEGVKPTRMELLAIRKKQNLAVKGHKLLSEKRDALIMQFFDVIKTRDQLRAEVNGSLTNAYSSFIESQMIMGQNQVEDVTVSVPPFGKVPTSVVNIMGVQVPSIDAEAVVSPEGPIYGYLETTAKLDEATDKFRKVLVKMLKLAEVEGSIERLANEIEKTKRRVNALEHIFIPRLKTTIKYIEMQLQEREREDFFRRKRIKAIMEKAEAA